MRSRFAWVTGFCSCLLGASPVFAQEVLRSDHYVPVVSTVPAMQGQIAQLYVRERATAEVSAAGNLDGKVVLFIHGAGTPAEVGFDVPVAGYSWMAYLAERGFDTFSMDMTGYGPSTRPYAMNDRCNLSAEQQQQEFGDACAATYPDAAYADLRLDAAGGREHADSDHDGDRHPRRPSQPGAGARDVR